MAAEDQLGKVAVMAGFTICAEIPTTPVAVEVWIANIPDEVAALDAVAEESSADRVWIKGELSDEAAEAFGLQFGEVRFLEPHASPTAPGAA